MATVRPRSDTEITDDRLSRLLATASGRHDLERGSGDDVWAELLAEGDEHRDEADVAEDEHETLGGLSAQEDPARAGGPPRGPAATGGGPPRGRHRPNRPVRVLTTPASLRGAQVSVNTTAVVGLVVVLVVVAAVLGVRWWLAEQSSVPRPLLPPEGQPAPVAAGPGAGGSAGAGDRGSPTGPADPVPGQGGDRVSTVTAPARLRVHVDGQVRHPGVVEVAAGARVLEAVDAAGGVTGEADLTRINLARPVVDGERVWIPAPGEEVPGLVDGGPAPVAPGGATGGATGGSGPDTVGGVPVVDLNTADQALLEELPGVGPATAQAILAWREEHGGFSSVEELLEVSGIGEKTLERLRPHVKVG